MNLDKVALPIEEGYVTVPGGRVWYKVVGSSDETPLLILHGGPGLPHNYLSPLENLASGRPVIFYDQLGCGKSDGPNDPNLWQATRFVEELREVQHSLNLERVHILGHSWGSMLAVDYALTQPAGLESLVLASPCLSMPRFLEDVTTYRKQLPTEIQEVLDQHETAGTTASEEYQEAVMVFYTRHLCRIDPWPEPFNVAAAGFNSEVYHTMWGPSELCITGNLATFDRTDHLHKITVPTLLTCGRFDETTPETTTWYQSLIQGAELTIFEQSSHMPHLEEAEHYLRIIKQFLSRVERT